MSIDNRFTLRHYQPDDYPALAELVNVFNDAQGIERRITAEELKTYIAVPDFNPPLDSFIFEDRGQVIAMSNQGFVLESGRCWADGVVHPDYWGRGIGAELLRLMEARALVWAQATLAADQPMTIQLAAGSRNPRALRLFEAHGYRHVRSFHQMRIDLDQPIAAPSLPDGLALRPFEWERDAHAVYEAHMDTFADHWDFEHETFDEWAEHLRSHPYRNFALWLVAYHGDEIAGICLNRAGGESGTSGWVGIVGVRKRWRKRGVGLALLRTSFARLQAQGYPYAELMVDASNETNAVVLYERAGMHVQSSRLVYHKTLHREVV